MSTPPLNLNKILSESKSIIKAHLRHFLALSVLFLLPSSFSIAVYPTLQQLLPQLTTLDAKTLLRHTYYNSTPMLDQESLVLTVFHIAFVFVLSLCAFASITFSVFHGFYCRPVKFISAIKSILTSFLPLLATTILCDIIVSGILVIFAIFLLLVVKLVRLIGFQFEYSSPYFLWFALILLIVLVLVLVYLQVNWALVYVVVVIESSWGLKPLKRSTSLIKGNRLVALSLYLYFSILTGIFVHCNSVLSSVFVGIGDEWSLAFVLQIVLCSFMLTWLFLLNAAATTVLYIYCKPIHGEIAEEFGNECVSLSFDDVKVPLLVSISYT